MFTIQLVDRKEVRVSYNGAFVSFEPSVFIKASYNMESFDLFKEFNSFINNYSPDKLEKIFSIYVRARELFNIILPVHVIMIEINRLIAELGELIDIDFFIHLVQVRNDVIIPSSFKTTYIDTQNTNESSREKNHQQASTREKTYLRDDYINLLGFTIALRSLFPIWGELIFQYGKEFGTLFKEYNAGLIIRNTAFDDNRAMTKLREYIAGVIGNGDSRPAALIDGVSSDEYPEWILYSVLVRRLSVGDVRGVEEGTTLITFIYAYMGQKNTHHDQSFGAGRVNEKHIDSSPNGDDESKTSVLENCKIRQDYSIGEVAEMSFFLEDPYKIAYALCPDLPEEILITALENIKTLEHQVIPLTSFVLTQYVAAYYLPPNTLSYIHKPILLGVMAAVQAVLWHRGFKDIAALISATVNHSPSPSAINYAPVKNVLTKEQTDTINTLYPNYRVTKSKVQPVKNKSLQFDTINQLSNKIHAENWKLNIAEQWIDELSTMKNVTMSKRDYRTPNDFKHLLVDFIIFLNRNNGVNVFYPT